MEYDRRTGRGETAYTLRNGHVDAIPVEGQTAITTSLCQIVRGYVFPRRIVKVRDPRVRRVIVGFHERPARLVVRSGGVESGLDDLRIAVFPLTRDELDAIGRCKIDRRFRLARWNILSVNSTKNKK